MRPARDADPGEQHRDAGLVLVHRASAARGGIATSASTGPTGQALLGQRRRASARGLRGTQRHAPRRPDPRPRGRPAPGRTLKAVATAGPSGGFLPVAIPVDRFPADHRSRLPEGFVRRRLEPGASHLNALALELNLEVFRALELALGAGIVAYDDRADMLEQAASASLFFRDESCGKCVPCRLGTKRLVEITTRLRQVPPDADALERHRDLVNQMLDVLGATSICGLGAVAAAPLASVLRYFSEDILI